MVKNKRCSISLLLNYINVCFSQCETKHTQIIGNDSPCLMDRQRLVYRTRQCIKYEEMSQQIGKIISSIGFFNLAVDAISFHISLD